MGCGCSSGPTVKEQTAGEVIVLRLSHETRGDFKEWQYIVGSINSVYVLAET